MEYNYCDPSPQKERHMLENAISDSDKEVENLSSYIIYEVLKTVAFVSLNRTLRIQ